MGLRLESGLVRHPVGTRTDSLYRTRGAQVRFLNGICGGAQVPFLKGRYHKQVDIRISCLTFRSYQLNAFPLKVQYNDHAQWKVRREDERVS